MVKTATTQCVPAYWDNKLTFSSFLNLKNYMLYAFIFKELLTCFMPINCTSKHRNAFLITRLFYQTLQLCLSALVRQTLGY